MPLASDLISAASAMLHGYGSTQDRVTPLASAIGPTDESFTVAYSFGQSVGITPGVVEIGSEQCYVVAVDAATGTCTLAPGFGRGYNGTTAVAHATGETVVSRPKFPRLNLLREMNNVIGSLYPDLFTVSTFSSTVTWPSDIYTLPTPAKGIIDVQWQDWLGNWLRVFGYMLDPYDGTFRLGSGPIIGRPLRIIYKGEPATFTAETDDFSVTGLPDSCSDLLTLGVVARLVPSLDISRAQMSSVEQSDRSRVVPPSAGVNVAKYIMAEFQDRLQNEAASLRAALKPRMTRTW